MTGSIASVNMEAVERMPVTSVDQMLQGTVPGVEVSTASSAPGDWVLDPFAGSGTTGAAARALGRRFVLVDENPDAIDVMRRRLGDGVLVTRVVD